MTSEPESSVVLPAQEPVAWEIQLVDQQHCYLVNSLDDPQVAIDQRINQPVVIVPLYAAPQPAPAQPPAPVVPTEVLRDAERLDWMAQRIVEVREHLRYGSKRVLFMASGYDEEDGITPIDIRAAIDNAKTIPATNCSYCKGSGLADSSGHGDLEACEECGGSGTIPATKERTC